MRIWWVPSQTDRLEQLMLLPLCNSLGADRWKNSSKDFIIDWTEHEVNQPPFYQQYIQFHLYTHFCENRGDSSFRIRSAAASQARSSFHSHWIYWPSTPPAISDCSWTSLGNLDKRWLYRSDSTSKEAPRWHLPLQITRTFRCCSRQSKHYNLLISH